jgi:urocanate hydratase
MNIEEIKKEILRGIPDEIPPDPVYDPEVNHAPRRKDILTSEEKKLAIRNALRYFRKEHHAILAKEFLDELNRYGRIYMYRYKPHRRITAGRIEDYPYRSKHAAAIMLMLNNNLDEDVAQHPHELITYGGNGAVFQNWAQYLLTMKYLATMTDEQTLVLYSGHPLGLFPSHKEAPRVVVSNGMIVPNYSSLDDYERFNALGVTQYGQMTAGSFMYIGPQGIVHGTTITVINAGRMIGKNQDQGLAGKVFVTSGLGGMSGAQPKATVIAGGICLVAEINPKAVLKRKSQGWIDEVYDNLGEVILRLNSARKNKQAVSIGYAGNVVDLWEKLAQEGISVELGSDQTSLHNPFAGGYYPAGLDFDESNQLMSENPEKFRAAVQESLKRQVAAINIMAGRGMYFWDYGNAFLLESGRAGAEIFKPDGGYRYPSYVEDIMGPLYFDFGFGPFRWVCTSNDPKDLELTDQIAVKILEDLYIKAPEEIKIQLADNIHWIREAQKNRLVVGSQARILYADCEGRITIAREFNKAIQQGLISAPVVLGRDHHDVSGTDSPFRETSNINDGSKFTADMAIHNVIGDAFRGATWVSIHNGGGVGWGEVINGGFGMVLDGTKEAGRRLEMMLYWDVNNGIARRSWARNEGAIFTARREMEKNSSLQVTIPNIPDENLINGLF